MCGGFALRRGGVIAFGCIGLIALPMFVCGLLHHWCLFEYANWFDLLVCLWAGLVAGALGFIVMWLLVFLGVWWLISGCVFVLIAFVLIAGCLWVSLEFCGLCCRLF